MACALARPEQFDLGVAGWDFTDVVTIDDGGTFKIHDGDANLVTIDVADQTSGDATISFVNDGNADVVDTISAQTIGGNKIYTGTSDFQGDVTIVTSTEFNIEGLEIAMNTDNVGVAVDVQIRNERGSSGADGVAVLKADGTFEIGLVGSTSPVLVDTDIGSGGTVQAYDADLDTYAAHTPNADAIDWLVSGTEADLNTAIGTTIADQDWVNAGFIDVVGSPTTGNFPQVDAGGNLVNSTYDETSFDSAGTATSAVSTHDSLTTAHGLIANEWAVVKEINDASVVNADFDRLAASTVFGGSLLAAADRDAAIAILDTPYSDTVAKSATWDIGSTGEDVGTVFVVDASGANVICTLHALSNYADGDSFTFVAEDTGGETYTLTIDGDAAETINGGTTITLTADYSFATVVKHGTEWVVVSGSGVGAAGIDYYTKSELDGGQLDTIYFQESEFLNSSAGAGDAGKPVKLDAAGNIDATMLNDADISHSGLTGTHNLTTDINHDTITNNHNLTTDLAPAWSSVTGTPTDLTGYGITDAQPLDADLTSWAGVTRDGDFDAFAAAGTPANLNTMLGVTLVDTTYSSWTASDVTDFDTEVGNHADVAANTTHSGLTTGNPHSLDNTDVGLGNVPNEDATAWANMDALGNSFALQTGATGLVEVSAVTSTELGHLDGVTSSIQTQLGDKLDDITGESLADLSDVTTTGTQLDGLEAALGDVTVAEGNQIENIGTVTIDNTQWGYLGAADQNALVAGSDVNYDIVEYNILQGAAFPNVTGSTDTFTTTNTNFTLVGQGSAADTCQTVNVTGGTTGVEVVMKVGAYDITFVNTGNLRFPGLNQTSFTASAGAIVTGYFDGTNYQITNAVQFTGGGLQRDRVEKVASGPADVNIDLNHVAYGADATEIALYIDRVTLNGITLPQLTSEWSVGTSTTLGDRVVYSPTNSPALVNGDVFEVTYWY